MSFDFTKRLSLTSSTLAHEIEFVCIGSICLDRSIEFWLDEMVSNDTRILGNRVCWFLRG